MRAVDYFNSGYSCSESILMEMIEKGYCEKELLSVASSFSGGMTVGCACGAITGSQIVIGYLYGKNNKFNNPQIARNLTNDFLNKFKSEFKVTCCKVLSKDYQDNPVLKKQHCSKMVEFCSNLLNDILKEAVVNAK